MVAIGQLVNRLAGSQHQGNSIQREGELSFWKQGCCLGLIENLYSHTAAHDDGMSITTILYCLPGLLFPLSSQAVEVLRMFVQGIQLTTSQN